MKRNDFVKLIATGAMSPVLGSVVACNNNVESSKESVEEDLEASSEAVNVQQQAVTLEVEDAFNSMAALKKSSMDTAKINNLSSSMSHFVQVLGYYEPGDGAGGTFYWDPKSKEPENGGTVIKPAFAGFEGRGRWKRLIQYPNVNIKWFGAKGDGETNNLPELQKAHQYALESGLSLFFPKGNTFAFDGAFNIEVDVISDGAWLKALSTTNKYHALTLSQSTENLTVKGLKIDGNNTAIGIYFAGFNHNSAIEDCTITNCRQGGVSVYSSDKVIVKDCTISNIQYNSTGVAADGIYFGGCKRCKAINNDISDFRRIGIVSESNGPKLSFYNEALHNTIYNAHDEDDSPTEFNKAIWFENTNGGKIIGNQIYNIANNPGQTKGGVAGIQAVALGTDRDATVIVQDNLIEVGDEATPSGIGIDLGGSNNYASVLLDNNEIRNVSAKAVSIAPGLKDVTINNLIVDNILIGGGANGIIVVDNSADICNSISINNLKYSNLIDNDTSGDWGHLNFFSGGTNILKVEDVDDFSIVTRGNPTNIKKIYVDNSFIRFGTNTGYASLDALEVYVSNSKISKIADRTDSRLISLSNDISAHFTNITFLGASLWAGNGTIDALFSNCIFNQDAHFDIDASGTLQFNFSNCVIKDYSNTTGFIRTNAKDAADRLFVRGCDFQNDSDVTPIQQYNFKPNVVVLNGNSYTSTSLYNFDSVNQEVNNIKT